MKQYNRIMLGEHSMYISDCLEHNYIGASFLKDINLNDTPFTQENVWRQQMINKYLEIHQDKSVQTARNCIGFFVDSMLRFEERRHCVGFKWKWWLPRR